MLSLPVFSSNELQFSLLPPTIQIHARARHTWPYAAPIWWAALSYLSVQLKRFGIGLDLLPGPVLRQPYGLSQRFRASCLRRVLIRQYPRQRFMVRWFSGKPRNSEFTSPLRYRRAEPEEKIELTLLECSNCLGLITITKHRVQFEHMEHG